MSDFLEEARRWAQQQREELNNARKEAPTVANLDRPLGDTAAAGAVNTARSADSSNSFDISQIRPLSVVSHLDRRPDVEGLPESLARIPSQGHRFNTASMAELNPTAQIKLLQAQLYEEQTKTEAAQARCVALEQALERYSKQGAALENQLETLGSAVREELSKMSDEADAAHSRIQSLEQQLSDQKSTIETLTNELNIALGQQGKLKDDHERQLQLQEQKFVSRVPAPTDHTACEARIRALETRLTLDDLAKKNEIDKINVEKIYLQRRIQELEAQSQHAAHEASHRQPELSSPEQWLGQHNTDEIPTQSMNTITSSSRTSATAPGASLRDDRAVATQHNAHAAMAPEVPLNSTALPITTHLIDNIHIIPTQVEGSRPVVAVDAHPDDASISVVDNGVRRVFHAKRVGYGPDTSNLAAAAMPILDKVLQSAATGITHDAVLVFCAAPSLAEKVLVDVSYAIFCHIFAFLNRSECTGAKTLAVSLLDVGLNGVSDALSVRKLDVAGTAQYSAPKIDLDVLPLPAATRVEVADSGDADLLVRTGLKSRGLLRLGQDDLSFTIVQIRIPVVPSVAGRSSTSCKVSIVAPAAPKWIATSARADDNGIQRAQSAYVSRSLHILGQCLKLLGSVQAAQHDPLQAGAVLNQLRLAVKETDITKLLADSILMQCSSFMSTVLPSGMDYSVDADAIAFLLLAESGEEISTGRSRTPHAVAATERQSLESKADSWHENELTEVSAIDPRALFPLEPPQQYAAAYSVLHPLHPHNHHAAPGPPLFAPTPSGGRRRGSLSRGYYLSKGVEPESLTMAAANDRFRESGTVGSSGRTSRRSSIASSHSVSRPRRGSTPGRHTVSIAEVDAEVHALEGRTDPKIRRLITEHDRRIRAYGRRGSDPSAVHSQFIPLEEYFAHAGPESAAAYLVSEDVFDLPNVQARASQHIQEQRAHKAGKTPDRARSSTRAATTKVKAHVVPEKAASMPRRASSTKPQSTRSRVEAATPPPQPTHRASPAVASRSKLDASTVKTMIELEQQIHDEMRAHAELSSSTLGRRSPVPAAAEEEGLAGDPVPGMRRLLTALRSKGVQMAPKAFASMFEEFKKADSERRGRLDDAAFAFALRSFARQLSWGEIEGLMRDMYLENCRGIDYADFVNALRTLASS